MIQAVLFAIAATCVAVSNVTPYIVNSQGRSTGVWLVDDSDGIRYNFCAQCTSSCHVAKALTSTAFGLILICGVCFWFRLARLFAAVGVLAAGVHFGAVYIMADDQLDCESRQSVALDWGFFVSVVGGVVLLAAVAMGLHPPKERGLDYKRVSNLFL